MGGAVASALGGAALGAIQAAAGALGGFAAESVSLAGTFEANMNSFQAAAGNMGQAEVEQFRGLFLQLGKDLPVSTTEVQQAAEALVKGGLDPAVLAAGALEQSLKFAAAAEMDLVSAAELGVKMLGVFGDAEMTAAEQATFLADAQNVLVQVANASVTNVTELGDAMLASAGQAQMLGMTQEELAVSLGSIMDKFQSGTEAGTSFKNFLGLLVPTTAPATEAMQELGLMTTNTTKIMEFLSSKGIEPLGDDLDTLGNQFTEFMASQGASQKAITDTWATFDQSVFFDMQGNFVGTAESAQLLKEAFEGVAEADKIRLAKMMFGNDAMPAFNALMGMGAEGVNEFAASVASSNGVLEQSAAMQQGFDFAMKNMQGSVEVLQITIGEMLIPVLESLLVNIITPGINTVTAMAEAFGGNAESMAALSPQLQAIVVGIQQAIPIIQQIAAEIGANWQPILATVAGVIGAVVVPALASFVIAAAPVIAAVVAAIAIGAALYGAWTSNFMGIQQITASALTAVQGLITSVMGVVLAFWQQNGAEIMAFAQVAWQGVQNIVGTVVAIVGEIVTRVFTGIAGFISAHGDEILAVLTTAWNNIQTIVDTTIKAVQGILNTTMALIKGDWEGALTEIKNVATTVWEGIKTVIGNNIDLVKGLIQGLMDKLGIDLKGTLDKVGGFFDPFKGALDGIGSAIQTVIDFVSDLISKFNALKDAIPDELVPGSPTPFEIGMRGIAGAIRTETIPAVQGLGGAMRGAGEGSQAISQRTYSLQRIVNVSQTFNSVPRGYRQDAAIVRALAGV